MSLQAISKQMPASLNLNPIARHHGTIVMVSGELA
jgi:hypothetical protein